LQGKGYQEHGTGKEDIADQAVVHRHLPGKSEAVQHDGM
jgi:hypothetical protein